MEHWPKKAVHNHAVQSSLAAMSCGAWDGSNPMFCVGLEQWDITIGSMREDGSLPIETRRGARALFYHGRTLAELTQLAERAELQSIDYHGRHLSAGKNIHKAVKFFIDEILKPKLVLTYAKANYVPGPSKDSTSQYSSGFGSSTFSWIAPYIARFPEHPNTQTLISIRISDSPLAGVLVKALKRNGTSAEWIGVNARRFYSSIKNIFKQ